jgi:hypothetical protein
LRKEKTLDSRIKLAYSTVHNHILYNLMQRVKEGKKEFTKIKRFFYLYERKLFWLAYYKVGAFNKSVQNFKF